KLWLPSELSADDLLHGCARGLVKIETELRVSQCLECTGYPADFCNANVTGQKASTKAYTLIGQVGDHVNASAAKYRVARVALVVMDVVLDERMQELKDADISLPGDVLSDTKAIKKLAAVTGERGARVARNAPGESKRVMSWIWMAQGVRPEGEQEIHDSVRVEWACAKARKLRWEEEVMLLREEMRRVMQYLEWQAGWWKERENSRPEATRELRAGIKPFALKQATFHLHIAAHFRKPLERTSSGGGMQSAASDTPGPGGS
ncbi:hypothetical protein C8J57DRAFT_1087843, partial [Mycena rebaudengoi]